MTITDSIDPAADLATPSRHGPAWRDAALVFLVALACYFPYPLDTPLAATEGHRAMTAHQMVESGQWLIPKLYGRVYLAKPPLHYWILAISETLFHTTQPWVWRLPGAIEGALLATILYCFGRRWFGRVGGLVSGFSYIAMFTLWGENRGADIDVTNTLTASLACLCLIELHLGRTRPGARAFVGSAPRTELSDSETMVRSADPTETLAPRTEPPDIKTMVCSADPTEPSINRDRQARVFFWTALAAISIGASLMVKGPASLTIILGTYIWLGFTCIRAHGWGWLARPAAWLPLVIGIALFAAYALAAKHYIETHHLVPDLSGVQEGVQDIHRHNISGKQVLEWLTLPVTMFLFSLPVSLSLLFGLNREVRGNEPVRSRLMLALAWSVLLAWGVCFLSGMHLPRYAFVTLPLLCPLAGAVAAWLPMTARSLATAIPEPTTNRDTPPVLPYAAGGFGPVDRRLVAERWMRVIVVCSVVIFGATGIVLGGISWKGASPVARSVIGVVATLLLLVVLLTVRGVTVGKNWNTLRLVPAVLVLTAVMFGTRQHYDRLRRTSVPQGEWIRSITGPGASLITCAMVLDQPDLFYYSGLPTRATDGDEIEWKDLPLGTWVVVEPQELKTGKSKVPQRIWNEHPFVANRNAGILLWYGEQPVESAKRGR